MDTGQPWGCRGLIHPWEINWERDGKPSLFFQSPAQGEHAGGAQGECPGGQGWGERQSVGSGTAAWAPLTLGAANVLPQHFSSALSIRESVLALVVNLRGASRLPAPAVRTATHSPHPCSRQAGMLCWGLADPAGMGCPGTSPTLLDAAELLPKLSPCAEQWGWSLHKQLPGIRPL